MDWSLRELRCFVTAVDSGSFTDAAAVLHVSQASVSRTVASLERQVGERLLRRTARGCEATAVGALVLPEARRLLAEADRFTRAVRGRHGVLRLGYAWAALGRHTTPLRRAWAAAHPDRELRLVRSMTATAGLAEGLCDVALLRRSIDEAAGYDSVVVGLERRLVAFAADDPAWARRRQLSLAEIVERTVLIDRRSGSTSAELWAATGREPEFVEIDDVEAWLDTIAAGEAVGITAEATAHQHARQGILYRPVKDGPRLAVRLAWRRDEPPAGLTELVDAVTRHYAGA